MKDRHIMSSEEMAPKYASFIKDHQALYSTILLTKDRDYPAEVFQRILDARLDPALTPEEVEAITHRELAALAPTAMPATYDPAASFPFGGGNVSVEFGHLLCASCCRWARE